MEDEGFVDSGFIEETAWDYVGRHGRASLPLLQRFARGADEAGEALAALTWRAVLEAAERILDAHGGPGGGAGDGA